MDGNLNEIREDIRWIANFLENQKRRHYGLWNDEKGWWWCYMKVYATTSKTLAIAQLAQVERGMGFGPPEETYRVRCIEEWADN